MCLFWLNNELIILKGVGVKWGFWMYSQTSITRTPTLKPLPHRQRTIVDRRLSPGERGIQENYREKSFTVDWYWLFFVPTPIHVCISVCVVVVVYTRLTWVLVFWDQGSSSYQVSVLWRFHCNLQKEVSLESKHEMFHHVFSVFTSWLQNRSDCRRRNCDQMLRHKTTHTTAVK